MSRTFVPHCTKVPRRIANLHAMNARGTFIKNLNAAMLWADIKVPELARRSGISARYLRYILAGERGPTVDVVADIAKALGLEGYHLQMPDFNPEIVRGGKLEKLYHAYSHADAEGKRVMETAADYLATHKTEAGNNSQPGNDKKPIKAS